MEHGKRERNVKLNEWYSKEDQKEETVELERHDDDRYNNKF
jgi:hypothetical protein